MTQQILLGILRRYPHPQRVTQATLTHLTGLRGEPTRKMIHDLRVEGHPIGSDSRGYFIALAAGDLDVTIAHLAGRAAAISVALQCVRKAQAELRAPERDLFGRSLPPLGSYVSA